MPHLWEVPAAEATADKATADDAAMLQSAETAVTEPNSDNDLLAGNPGVSIEVKVEPTQESSTTTETSDNTETTTESTQGEVSESTTEDVTGETVSSTETETTHLGDADDAAFEAAKKAAEARNAENGKAQLITRSAATVASGGALPGKNDLIIRSDVDNTIENMSVDISPKSVASIYSKKATGSNKDDYGNLKAYQTKVYSKYANVNGAKSVVFNSAEAAKNATIEVTYPQIGTYNKQPVGAKLIISNILPADSSSWTSVNQPVIDFATSLYSGMVYDDIKGMDISFQFIDGQEQPVTMDKTMTFLTFASLNSSKDNANSGAEYVFPGYDTTSYLTPETALIKGTPAKGKSLYPYKNEAFFGSDSRSFGDELNSPDYVNGAVSFNIGDNQAGSKFTLGSLASRAWTSFMSSVLVPIDPGAPNKKVTESTGWTNRNKDELDILVAGQDKVTINGKNSFTYFINQHLYDSDESIARPTSIKLTDHLPKYIKPTKVSLLQENGQIADLSSHLTNLKADGDGRYLLDITLSSEEMKKVNFDGKDLTWQITVETVGDPEGVANSQNETIKMANTAKVSFLGQNSELFTHETNQVVTQIIPETFSISAKKIWSDDENKFKLRKPITIQLQGSYDSESWKELASSQSEILSVGQDTITFNKLPAKINQKTVYYRIVEISENEVVPLPGYQAATYSEPRVVSATSEKKILEVTNTLVKTELKFTKVNKDGKPLSGAKFTLIGDNGYCEEMSSNLDGTVSFSGLPIGDYTLKETTAPNGYAAKSWKFEVVQNDKGTLSIKNSPLSDGKLTNDLKSFNLEIVKTDDNQKPLSGAVFKLTGTNFDKTIKTGPEFNFEGLQPGSYTLTEISAPNGYQKLKNSLEITILSDGTVTVSGYEKEDITVSLKGGSENNTISFAVKNTPKVPLPATGGSGIWLILLTGGIAVTAAGIYFLRRKDQGVA